MMSGWPGAERAKRHMMAGVSEQKNHGALNPRKNVCRRESKIKHNVQSAGMEPTTMDKPGAVPATASLAGKYTRCQHLKAHDREGAVSGGSLTDSSRFFHQSRAVTVSVPLEYEI